MASLGKISNTHLTLSSPAWLQASLPVRYGGLGIHSAVDVAPSAILASSYATASLVHAILPASQYSLHSPSVSGALSVWSSCAPSGDAATRQKAWDHPRAESASLRLLEVAQNCEDRARLLAASRRESGA